MRNMVLSFVVVSAMLAAGIGGTFAGFVDTEESLGNSYQAGIIDLLVNGKNDPNVPARITVDCGVPCNSIDRWIGLYNWGQCTGGFVFMHFKNVVSEEDGKKSHLGAEYVYDGLTPGTGWPGIPAGYRVAVGNEPKGPGVWSSEPERIAEVGGGRVWQIDILPLGQGGPWESCLMGEDYASGIAEHLVVTVTVPLKGLTGDVLGNPDANGDGVLHAAERAAWQTAGNRWKIIANLNGHLNDIQCKKTLLGRLLMQEKTFVRVSVHLQQIECPNWPDKQTKWWPTNALQGDKATWDMLFELTTDVP